MTWREILRDPDTRAVVLVVINLVGGFAGSRLSLAQVRGAAARAVAPVAAALEQLTKRVEVQEKFSNEVRRFIPADPSPQEKTSHG